MARVRSRVSETEMVNPRLLGRRAVKRQNIDQWAVGQDELAPGVVGETHLHPTTLETIREIAEGSGVGQMLVMSASSTSVATGGHYIDFDTVVEQHGFHLSGAGSSWIMPVTAVGVLTVEFAWADYDGGGTIDLEVDGVVPPSGVVAGGTTGRSGHGTVPFYAAAGATCRLKITHAAGSSKVADVTVRVAIPDPALDAVGPRPADVPVPDLLWLDGADLTVAGALGSWTDKSGAGNTVTQSTAANKPTVTLAARNGLPVVSFDGVNDLLTVALATTSAQPVTMFMVVHNTDPGPFENIREAISCDPVGAETRSCELAIDTAGRVIIGSASGTNLQGPSSDTSWHVYEAVVNGASSVLSLDGESNFTGNAGGSGFDGTLHLGGRFTDFWLGDIAEVRVHAGALDSAARALVRAELLDKWGI